MNEYFEFLDKQEDLNPLYAPSMLADEFGIEYRIAVDIVTEWTRVVMNRRNNAD